MVELLSVHIVGPTMFVNLTPAKESVAEFANRFNQTQFELEKLVLNIHRLQTTKDTHDICYELELIHAFVNKLKTLFQRS